MRRSIAVIGLLGLMLTTIPANHATAASSLAITCSAQLPQWPSPAPRNGGSCDGTAIGVSASSLCLPTCAFRATIDSYRDDCIGADPSATGTGEGSMYVGGELVGRYRFTRTGTALHFTPTDGATVVGEGHFVPQPPVGTCITPAFPQAVTIYASISAP